jgi:alpha-tubulin suppressor-like RCC1 family protein
MQIVGLVGVTAVTTGEEHSCAVTTDAQVKCWGNNTYGQLGNGRTAAFVAHPTPALVVDAADSPLSGITSVTAAARGQHTCALRSDQTVWCWGSNWHGNLGDGSEVQRAYATQVVSAAGHALASIVDVSAGSMHTCAKKIDKTVWCWGNNQWGQLGIGYTSLKSTTPVQAFDADSYPLQGVEQLAADVHTCAVMTDARTWCWGYNRWGQLGNQSTRDEPVPVLVQGLPSSTAISAGWAHTCALASDATVWCWGNNLRGQLGDGSVTNRLAPTKVGANSFTEVARLHSGDETNCSLKFDGSAWCWGANGLGQVGNGTWTSYFATPARVKSHQSITFSAIANRSMGQPRTFTVDASASSSLPVELRASGSCSVLNSEVTVVADGTCRITASQDGNESYVSAAWVTQEFAISKVPQAISFSSISNKSVIAAPFTVSVNASSGLPVTLYSMDTSVCEVSGFVISVMDVGTCDIRAYQLGNDTYLAAYAGQSFEVTRVLLSNKTVSFVDAEGKAVVGLNVTWETPDGQYRSTTSVATNASGSVTYSSIPAGSLTFKYGGMRGNWISYGNLSASVRVTTAPVKLTVQTGELTEELTVQVQLEDGTPVPGASVALDRQFNTGFMTGDLCAGILWRLLNCSNSARTSIDGAVRFLVVKRSDVWRNFATVSFADGDITQTSSAEIEDGIATVTLEQLPVVEILAADATVGYAVPRTITAVARDSSGDPIAGQALTLSASVSGASGNCTGKKTTSTTGSTGLATFKVCPVKTAVWSVDGASIVGSSGVTLTVQSTPTAPRSLTSTGKTRAVALTWTAPASVNIGTVTDYIVQYRVRGSSAWITFRDGTSTLRRATVTGLIKGRVYEFRIAAKNKAGTGTWSITVLRAAK